MKFIDSIDSTGKVIKILKNYEKRRKRGEEPAFLIPKELGIKDADYWTENQE